MNGTAVSDAPIEIPSGIWSFCAAARMSLYAFGWLLKVASALTKSWCEWVMSSQPRTRNASSWMPTRARMTCARRRIETRDTTPTTSSMTTLIAATAPWLVTLFAASLIAELLKAAPRAVSMNGVYGAAQAGRAAAQDWYALWMFELAFSPQSG